MRTCAVSRLVFEAVDVYLWIAVSEATLTNKGLILLQANYGRFESSSDPVMFEVICLVLILSMRLKIVLHHSIEAARLQGN